MTALSKPAEADDGAREKMKQLNCVMSHVTINMAVSILNFSTRGEILRDIVKGDFATVGRYLGRWTAITALIEFLLNPTIGTISYISADSSLHAPIVVIQSM